MKREEYLLDRLIKIAQRYEEKHQGLYDWEQHTVAEATKWLRSFSLPPAEGASNKFRDVLNEVQRLIEINDGATGGELRAIWNNLSFAITESERRPQPTAEGAEEILESIVESLGDPIYIHNHVFEIRPYTVEHKTEWWIFHKEVGSGEPLAQWLNKFATLHAQRLAEKMVEERLKKEYERGIEDGKIIGEHGSVSYIE